MSRLYAELMRRRAPPPYHEAMLTSRNFDEVQQEYIERLQNATRRTQRRRRSHRRSSRNQHTSSSSDTREESNENSNVGTTDGNNMQLASISEENENPNNSNIHRSTSQTELIPSDSETDSSDLEDDLETDQDGREGHGQSREGDQVVTNDNDEENDDDDEDDDDDNILSSELLSAQWTRNVNCDDDDECILVDETLPALGRGYSDNASIDTEASASILSMETIETRAGEVDEDKNSSDSELEQNFSDREMEECQNSRNSTPKPENRHESRLIETQDGFLMRGPSQNSLDSAGSETYSENDVPMRALDSVSQF